MALQTENLVMIGLGIRDDQPPDVVQPQLKDGIHLRWAFQRDLGFPWYGFHLLRRPHLAGDGKFLSWHTIGLRKGPFFQTEWVTPVGSLSSDQHLDLVDEFPRHIPNSGDVEFNLEHRRYLHFTLPQGTLARQVRVWVGFRRNGKIRITALTEKSLIGSQGEILVDERIVEGQANGQEMVELEFDAITAIHIESGPAVLVDCNRSVPY